MIGPIFGFRGLFWAGRARHSCRALSYLPAFLGNNEDQALRLMSRFLPSYMDFDAIFALFSGRILRIPNLT